MSLPNKVWLACGLLLLATGMASARSATVDSNLNLRAGPGPSHRVLVMIPAGASVTIGACEGDWCRVDYGSQRGYVSRIHLDSGHGAFAAAPPQQQHGTKYRPDDEVRVWQWQNPEWRERYQRDPRMRGNAR